MRQLRYWLYLAGKFMLAALAIDGLNYAVTHSFSVPPRDSFGQVPMLFLHDIAFTFAVIGVWLASAGLLWMVVWDQRRRCRSCLRRLIMPVRTGSWGNMLTFGRPTVEWICAYGHGTLRIDELQITGKDTADWHRHDDNIWKELESYYEAPK